jgi:TetR/AcrR family transcriptional regulator, ethionamide resistance regulator
VCDTVSTIYYDGAMTTRRAELRHTREQSRERIVAAVGSLVRRVPFAELTVDDVMREAGFGRTIFYRHFDDLGELLMRAGREAIDELLDAQVAFSRARMGDGPAVVRSAIEPAVSVYERHGPLLRAISEAAAVDERISAGQDAIRERFRELVEQALRDSGGLTIDPSADLAEVARALNLMNEKYLLDTFGREPRVSAEQSIDTLTAIWLALTDGR